MKSLIQAAVLSAALIVPALSFAQTSNAPLTRAQVRAELIQLEQAGYHPALTDPYYPDQIQAAEARVAQRGDAQSSFGGVQSGASQGGRSE